MNYYLEALRKYAVFEGRSRRREYWYFILFNFLIGFVLGLVEGVLGILPGMDSSMLANIYSLLVLIPGIAVTVRRLHDTNRSGWWLLIGIIPLIGAIILIIFLVQDSSQESNQYGANPKYY